VTFNQREWVNDIAAGAVAGAMSGAAGAMFVPDPPFAIAVAAGAICGLVVGLVTLPIRWLLDLRPPANGEKDKQP
jgi:hypothetical protein